GAAELDERLGDLTREQPGQATGGEECGQPGERHGTLYRAHLRVHGRERGRDPDDGGPCRTAAYRDVNPPLVGGRAETLGAAHAIGQRLLNLGPQQVVLEPVQRRAVELGVSSDGALSVDERPALTDDSPQLATQRA